LQIYTFALMKIIKTLLIFLILFSCNNQDKVKQVDVEIDSQRFDLELFTLDSINYDSKILEIENNNNKGFLDYYLKNHIGMIYDNDSIKKSYLLTFISHPDVVSFQSNIQNKFDSIVNLKNYEKKIKSSFEKYLSLFPDSIIPKKIIYINSFNSYAIDSYNHNLVIGLDFYLGILHPASNIWDYLRFRYNERYMISDIMEYWITSSFVHNSLIVNFQDELIFKGKIMYLMNQVLEEKDHILFRYSEKDLEWCKNNESNIWNEIINLDLMYNKDHNSYATFFTDSPFTKGMPQESPGRLGYWVGYKIIDSYMQNNNVTLHELMQNTNSQNILLQSKYKP